MTPSNNSRCRDPKTTLVNLGTREAHLVNVSCSKFVLTLLLLLLLLLLRLVTPVKEAGGELMGGGTSASCFSPHCLGSDAPSLLRPPCFRSVALLSPGVPVRSPLSSAHPERLLRKSDGFRQVSNFATKSCASRGSPSTETSRRAYNENINLSLSNLTILEL